jgi:hypothetical protein
MGSNVLAKQQVPLGIRLVNILELYELLSRIYTSFRMTNYEKELEGNALLCL